MIKKVNIIGTGNSAHLFAQKLKGKIEVVSLFSRKPKVGEVLANFLDCHLVHDYSKLSTEVDLNLVCVSDDAISLVQENLNKEAPVVHCSGSVEMNSFKNFKNFGVVYPLQTISKNRVEVLQDFPCLIEANNLDFERELREFALQSISEKTFVMNSLQRKKIHVGAVVVNNFTNHLLHLASSFSEKNDFPFEIYQDLMKETIDKAFDIGPSAAQTGPALRGDKRVIADHLSLIQDDKLKDIYKLFTESIDRTNS